MNSLPDEIQEAALALSKTLRSYSAIQNFGIKQLISWIVDEENKQIAFLGRESFDSHPTYYDNLTLARISKENSQVQQALNKILELNYKVVAWWKDDEPELPDQNLWQFEEEIDLEEYKQLLANFPPRVLHSEDQANQLAQVLDELNGQQLTPAQFAYQDLLLQLLLIWLSHHPARTEGLPIDTHDCPF